eukprot:3856118-Lingulodinium_polyedra.AAC.1
MEGVADSTANHARVVLASSCVWQFCAPNVGFLKLAEALFARFIPGLGGWITASDEGHLSSSEESGGVVCL